MDFNGNDYDGQCAAESSLGRSRLVQKICYNENNEEETASRRSSCSLEITSRGEYQTGCQQCGNYTSICEHERGGGNPNDENSANCNDENTWEHGDLCYESYVCESDADWSDNVRGISRRDGSEKKGDIETKYNVSFKRKDDSIDQMWSKRKQRSNLDNRVKKKIKRSKRDEDLDGNVSNFRCTFENCCGNCEPYVMEIPRADFDAYQNWRNMNFESEKNTCFEDCCCPWKMKTYSSNLSVCATGRTEKAYVTCEENVKPCPPEEPKCPPESHGSSKLCIQRVHFTKPRHSSCSFCSRKCTPSKASLFVEIGESVADVCDLRLSQVLQLYDESTESLGSVTKRKEYPCVRRNKSDTLRKRSKSNKRGDLAKKCIPNCTNRSEAMGRSFSDRIASMEQCLAKDTIEQINLEGLCNQKINLPISTASCQDRECRKHTESCTSVCKKLTSCNRPCKTCDRSFWRDIRRSKFWLELQGTCKNLVKSATASIGQMAKQTSRIIRSKKCTKNTCGKKSGQFNPCTQQSDLAECLHDRACWKEIMSDEAENCEMPCCQNICYSFNENSNSTELTDCQKYDYHNYHHDAHEQAPSNRSWHSDPCDFGVQGNVYPSNGGSITDSQCFECAGIRKRGGSDDPRDQKRRQLNPTRNLTPTTRSPLKTSNNRRIGNPKSRENPRQSVIRENENTTEAAVPDDQESERTTARLDIQTEKDIVITETDAEGQLIATKSMSYMKTIRSVKKVETFSEAKPDIATPRKLSLDAKTPETPGTPETSRKRAEFVTSTPLLKSKGRESETRKFASRRGSVLDDASSISSVTTSFTGECVNPDAVKAAEVYKTPKTADSSAADGTMFPDVSTISEDPTTSSKKIDLSVRAQMGDLTKESVPAESTLGTNITDTSDEVVPAVTEPNKVDPPKTIEIDDSTVVKPETDQMAVITLDGSNIKPVEAVDLDTTKSEQIVDISLHTTETDHLTNTHEATDTGETSKVDNSTTYTSIQEPVMDTQAAADNVTAVDNVDLAKTPAKLSRKFEGRRNYASVEMQTSSTILTKIVSEFWIGNKRKQLLMNIKLQTNLDSDDDQAVDAEDEQAIDDDDHRIADEDGAELSDAEVRRPS